MRNKTTEGVVSQFVAVTAARAICWVGCGVVTRSGRTLVNRVSHIHRRPILALVTPADPQVNKTTIFLYSIAVPWASVSWLLFAGSQYTCPSQPLA